MRTTDYKLDHLFDMEINFDKYPLCQGKICVLHDILEKGITITITDNEGKPIAIISVLIYHPGVAGIHIIPSVEAHKKKKFTFIREVYNLRRYLDDVVRIYKLRRVETLTIDDKEHNRWMEYLGFLADGTKEKYGINGEDFIMWSRLWG